ncbi:MAG: efflux RND transporter permease subunit [Nitrosomonas sp.]|nr:efflux RND transporter permease subunit [Nitrosomonas sp.]
MTLPELCIRRPVMTVLLSLAAMIGGLLAYQNIPIASLPNIDTPVITVTAILPGAGPETMATAVATPMERQFANIAGLAQISSTNRRGLTTISLEFVPERDIDGATIDIQSALLNAQRLLPVEMTTFPSYRKISPTDLSSVLLSLVSDTLPYAELNRFAENFIAPALSTLPGIAEVRINGQKKYAVRINVDPVLLASRDLTINDVGTALAQINNNSPMGTLEGQRQILVIETGNQLANAADFSQVIIKTTADGRPIRLAEIATIEDSVESTKTASWTDGKQSLSLSVYTQPGANLVTSVDAVKKTLVRLNEQLPPSVSLQVLADRSLAVREAIHDAQITFVFTVLLVVLVIFLFLRKPRATLIPVFSLPISILVTFIFIRTMGFTLDNISLLAITLAVGLVVDDAIVVLENIVRHSEQSLSPMQAAIKGSREITFTIISISLSLAIAFIPLFFISGVIGQMFEEFAAVITVAVLVSAVVSLTLVPMLASRQPPESSRPDRLAFLTNWFTIIFDWLTTGYTYLLDWSLAHRKTILLIAISTLFVSVSLFMILPKGFFPEEDTGRVMVVIEAAEEIAFPAMTDLLQQAIAIIGQHPHVQNNVVFTEGSNVARFLIDLKPRADRPPAKEIQESLRKSLQAMAGIRAFVSSMNNIRLGSVGSRSRFQYVLRGLLTDELYPTADSMINKMRGNPVFRDVSGNMQLRSLQAKIEIDRDKAQLLGVDSATIRSAMFDAFGERQIASIYTASDTYRVILQADDAHRVDENALSSIHVRSERGNLVPLSSMVSVTRGFGPSTINRMGQLEAITLSFNLAPDTALGEATALITQFEREIGIPDSIVTSYAGDAAAFQTSQTGQLILIISSLLVIYVLLGVLYESYIHPITILSGLPSAAVGALLTLWLFDLDISIIAMIGMLLLIAIVKKNAIMMIDFALVAQRTQKLPPLQAIRSACLLRFRPIMMTTLTALVGALPIAMGLGAGAELRQPLGLVVVGGLLFSQVITLIITPVIYLYLDRFSGCGPIEIDHDENSAGNHTITRNSLSKPF